MTYPEIIREIGKRVNDDTLMNSRAVAGNYFIESLINIMLHENTDIGQLGDFYKALDFNLSTDGWVNFTQTYELPNNTLKVLDAAIDSGSYATYATSPVSLKKITKTEADRMFLEDSFRPSGTELFYYYRRLSSNSKQGLEFIVSSEYYTSGTLTNVPLRVDIYLSPKLSDFTSTEGDVLSEYNLGTKVVYDAITLASANILALKGGGK